MTLKVLWGCTVGYPSDSLASCSFHRTTDSSGQLKTSDFTFAIDLPFCSFFIRQLCVSPRLCENLAYIAHPFLPKFYPKVTRPLGDLSVRHLIANRRHMVTHSVMITMESLEVETTIAVWNGTIADPLRPSLSPKWELQVHCTWISSRWVLPPGEYDRRVMSPVAKLLCSLLPTHSKYLLPRSVCINPFTPIVAIWVQPDRVNHYWNFCHPGTLTLRTDRVITRVISNCWVCCYYLYWCYFFVFVFYAHHV